MVSDILDPFYPRKEGPSPTVTVCTDVLVRDDIARIGRGIVQIRNRVGVDKANPFDLIVKDILDPVSGVVSEDIDNPEEMIHKENAKKTN